MDSNQVAEAKGRYAEAERATSLKGKAELYFSASKLYLNAVNSVTDDNLKRSLIYLSNVCISKATSCMSSREVLPSRPADDECASLMLNSERAIQQAHVAKQLRTEDVSTAPVYFSVKPRSQFLSFGLRYHSGIEPPQSRLFETCWHWSPPLQQLVWFHITV